MILDSQFLAIFFQLPASGEKNQRFTAARPKICLRRPNQQSPPRFVLFFVEVSGEGSLIEVAISEDKSIGAKKSVTNLSSL